MRQYSKTEKRIIKNLANNGLHGFTVEDILFQMFPNEPFMQIESVSSVVQGQPNFRLLINRRDQQSYLNHQRLFQVINQLIDDLIRDNLINISENRKFHSVTINPQRQIEGQTIWLRMDFDRYDLFKKLSYTYKPKEALLTLVENNFRSTSDKIGLFQIIVAIIGILVTITIAYISCN